MKRILFILILTLISFNINAQLEVKAPEGYTHDIGNMISMLDNLKSRVERLVVNLNQEETDFLIDENANRIGAIIYHLAATEKYYQIYTFENRQFNEAEKEKWMIPLSLGDVGREELKGKPIKYYLDIFDEVRAKTKELLKTKDDDWFSKKNEQMTNHWAWFHVMEHQANHMGQLAFLTKRLP
ncbi:DinB family protein [Flaviramulus sp. BrNp1-15]|uniref:DinB family protein n=1 Tax=Flaviramulus sp. BrNp1-15 TaxID=2916754 RepID=UPI001EE8E706|nr:DinB family protein [Flaviramulus sp. BrNp1-15]ULC60198.1 DinB family protein [Flaviramulus sp. BrNp1-15]